jgi:hypothetical protein
VAGAQEGAFDEAVKGVDAIEHTASPFHLKADDPDGASRFTIRISSHIEARYYWVLRTDCSCCQRDLRHTPKCSEIWVRISC